MDLYLLLKFAHVIAAVLWVGAGVGLCILGIAASAASDRDGFMRIIRNVGFLAPRLFMPASVAAFIFGFAAAWMGWGFSMLWVWLGIVGYAATFLTGNFLLRPRAERIGALIARDGVSDEAFALGNELLQISKFDYVMLFVVIADMVFKPTPTDWPVLAAMGLALAAAAIAFLPPVFRAHRAVTA
ncbi:MAG TPA: DUF2269 family protein [Bauldia sp.]|nr:DUF2269 family protein [Bauldia sp.]